VCVLVSINCALQCRILRWFVACVEDSLVDVMDLISALVEADSLPSELLQQMLTTDAASTVKEQQVINTLCINVYFRVSKFLSVRGDNILFPRFLFFFVSRLTREALGEFLVLPHFA